MKKFIKITALIFLVILVAITATYLVFRLLPPKKISNTERSGLIFKDEIWSGTIWVKSPVVVPKGITLTIEPGTVVKFKHDRNYKTFNKANLKIKGGTVKAIGTKDEMIWFTSDASQPVNGDWWGISLHDSTDSKFDYTIVEFGEMGIEQFDSAVPVTNSIIRWSNAEGLYAERSEPIFKNNIFYGNGYHDIALEQYNKNVQILNNIFKDSNYGIHHEKTESYIEGNYFKNYKNEVISAGMESNIVIKKNRFEEISIEKAISIGPNSTAKIEDNDFGDGSVSIPQFDYQDIKNYDLGYIPGDPEDKFPYIYDEVDETRRTIKKIGKNLSFGWALVYAENFLWRFSLGSGEIGESLDFIKVDPTTGDFERFGNDEIMNPRGLTWDGKYFWVNDFSLLKIFKFELAGYYIKIVDSFDIPEKGKGGTSGLTTDGEFLYLRSRDNSKVYKLNKKGDLVDKIQMKGGTLVWTGKYFWTAGGCEKGICKYTEDGKLVGEIYPPAKDTWAIAWDGKYLWTIQRTCEMWNDSKIYQIEILDDSLR